MRRPDHQRSRAPFRAAVLAASLAAALLPGPAAIAGPDPSTDPAASTGPTPSVAPMPSLTPIEPATVEVLDPGRRPRRERRYAFAAGQREQMQMRQSMAVTTDAGAGSMTIALPPVEYVLELHVLEVDADGVATVAGSVVSVTAVADPDAPLFDAAAIETLNAELARLVGMRTLSRVDARGITREVAVDVAGLDPAIAQQVDGLMNTINQLAAPLPAEPVGEGARWVTRGVAQTMNVELRTEQTSTLRRADGGTLVLRIDGTQGAVPGPVDSPQLPEGVTATVEALTGTILGRMTLDLGRLVPTSTADGTVAMRLSATDGTTTQLVEMTITATIEVAPGAD